MIYPSINGNVVEGSKISRQLGFPTLNLEVDKNLAMKYGVYAGFMEYEGKIYQGVMNIGITPSFKIDRPKLEFHVFNFNQDLYGKKVIIIPTHFIREEMKFNNMKKLIAQIKNDCQITQKLLSNKIDQ